MESLKVLHLQFIKPDRILMMDDLRRLAVTFIRWNEVCRFTDECIQFSKALIYNGFSVYYILKSTLVIFRLFIQDTQKILRILRTPREDIYNG